MISFQNSRRFTGLTGIKYKAHYNFINSGVSLWKLTQHFLHPTFTLSHLSPSTVTVSRPMAASTKVWKVSPVPLLALHLHLHATVQLFSPHLLRRPCNACELRNLSELIHVKNNHFFWTALFNPDQVSDPISRGGNFRCKRASLQGQPVELQPPWACKGWIPSQHWKGLAS